MKNDFYPTPVLKKYNILKQAVIGFSDGLIIPFAICTGLSALNVSNNFIIQAGLLAIAAGMVIFGAGGYFAAKNRQDDLALQSKEEEEKNKNAELKKTVQLFKALELSEDMQTQAATEIEKDSAEWKAYLQKHSQELEKPDVSQLPKTALLIAFSFAVAGIIPLLPYTILENKKEALYYSIACCTIFLPVTGYIKSYINKEPLVWGAIRLLMLGLFTALAAYTVAKIFTP